jgi:hypothetical protein
MAVSDSLVVMSELGVELGVELLTGRNTFEKKKKKKKKGITKVMSIVDVILIM